MRIPFLHGPMRIRKLKQGFADEVARVEKWRDEELERIKMQYAVDIENARAGLVALQAAREEQMREKEKLYREEQEIAHRRRLLEERDALSDSFRPGELTEEYNKMERLALSAMSGTMIEVLEKIARNIQRELSMEAMARDGDKRDKPLWMSYGIHQYVQVVKDKMKAFEKENIRTEAAKVKEVRQRADSGKRDVMSLYRHAR